MQHETPYFAVIFTSKRRDDNHADYDSAATKMLELVSRQEGYLGHVSIRDPSGLGVTISYWRDEKSIASWQELAEHRHVQQRGRDEWYSEYDVRVCRVEREYSFRIQDNIQE